MRRNVLLGTFLFLAAFAASAQNPTYSTGAVNEYVARCGISPDLTWRVLGADWASQWYTIAGFPSVSNWRNGDVFGSDFRDGAAGTNDADPGGGSDAPQLYHYSGHGTCQNPPVATDPDFITVCGNFGAPQFNDIGANARWGSSTGGKLQFLLLDASCPMDLVSLGNDWFPVFQGLHVATGHSGDSGGHDTLDSPWRPGNFAAYIVGGLGPAPTPGFFGPTILFPPLSIGQAWMATGLQDVQPSTCAVVIAAGATEAECIDRRENERVTDGRPDPIPNWFGWRWVCN